MSTLAIGSQIGWQSLIRQRLEERDVREKAFDVVIDNCELHLYGRVFKLNSVSLR